MYDGLRRYFIRIRLPKFFCKGTAFDFSEFFLMSEEQIIRLEAFLISVMFACRIIHKFVSL